MRQITELHEIQELALKIFAKFDEFCSEYEMEYFMAYGTLIGTIRHKGFIPWDDDIDVWMKREDYTRFVRLFPEWGKRHGLYLNSVSTTPKYNRIFAKICMEHSKVETLDRHNDYEEGYFIDVFVLEGSPNKKLARFLRITHLQFLRNIVTLAAYGADQLPNPSVKTRMYAILSKFLRRIDQSRVIKRFEKVASKSQTGVSDYLLVPIRRSKGRALQMPSEWFSKSIKQSFEQFEASVPIGYDKILTLIYGDYMQLPPVEQRKPGHAAKFYLDD